MGNVIPLISTRRNRRNVTTPPAQRGYAPSGWLLTSGFKIPPLTGRVFRSLSAVSTSLYLVSLHRVLTPIEGFEDLLGKGWSSRLAPGDTTATASAFGGSGEHRCTGTHCRGARVSDRANVGSRWIAVSPATRKQRSSGRSYQPRWGGKLPDCRPTRHYGTHGRLSGPIVAIPDQAP